MSIGYDSAKVPAVTASTTCSSRSTRARSPSTATPRRPARRSPASLMAALAQGGSADDIAPGRRLLPQAEGGRQLPAGRPDAGDHRVRPDAGRHRLGLPATSRRPPSSKGKLDWKVVVPAERRRRRLLLPGHQQGRPAPGGRPAVAGVPLQRRGPEPLAARAVARPVRADAMRKAGTIDKAALAQAARRSTAPRSSLDPEPDRQGQPSTWRTTGRRRSADLPGSATAAAPRAGRRRRRPSARAAGCCRSSATSRIFLIIPTLVVIVGAFLDDGGQFSLGNVQALAQPRCLPAFGNSVHRCRPSPRSSARCSGGLLAWLDRHRPPDGVLRRVITSPAACWPSSAASHWRSRSWPPSGSTAC